MNELHLNGTAAVLEKPVLADDALLRVHDLLLHGQVEGGMTALLPVLQSRRLADTDAEWTVYVQHCLAHPLRKLVHQDPFTYRAFSQPRGYAGDAVLLDYIYGVEEGWGPPVGATELGKEVFAFTTHSAACAAVRARRGFIGDLIDRFADEVCRPHILSLAAGHLREADLAAAVRRRKIGRYVALDADEDSLQVVERSYGRCGVETVHARIRQILTGRIDLGRFDLVYSTGLFDYVPQSAAQNLTRLLFQLLRPRGRLVVANFLPGILDIGYMESYMGWKLIFRTRQEMLDLMHAIPQAEIREIKIFAEENQNIIFLEVTRQ